MEKTICFFDIDGTLLDKQGKIPESTCEALHRAKKNGIYLMINTGRTKYILPEELNALPLDGLICGCGTYLEAEQKVVYHHQISLQECREMADRMEEFQMGAVYEHTDRVSLNPFFQDTREQQGFQSLFEEMELKVGSTQDPDFIFDKFFAWYHAQSDVEAFKKMIQNRYHWIHRGPGRCEIVPEGCSKANGMKQMARIYGVREERIFAFGDSENDREMLKEAGIGIAMGENSGLDGVIDYTTSKVEEDGIYRAMEKFQLI